MLIPECGRRAGQFVDERGKSEPKPDRPGRVGQDGQGGGSGMSTFLDTMTATPGNAGLDRARPRSPSRGGTVSIMLSALQQTAGNKAVSGLLTGAAGPPVAVQRCGPNPCNCSDEERAAVAPAIAVSREVEDANAAAVDEDVAAGQTLIAGVCPCCRGW